MLLNPILKAAEQDGSFVSQLSILRALRLLRIIRLLSLLWFFRVVQEKPMFREFRILLGTLSRSIHAITGVCLLIVGMVYVAAVCLTEGALDTCKDSTNS